MNIYRDAYDEFEDEVEDKTQAQSQKYQDVAEIEDIDNFMSEAEKRFEVAQYYKLLLQDSLFDVQTEASVRVENEVRAFVRESLNVLLGVKEQKQRQSEFSVEQVAILKEFADLGENGPKVLSAVIDKLSSKIEKPNNPSAPTLNVKEKPQAEGPSLKKRALIKPKANKPEVVEKSTTQSRPSNIQTNQPVKPQNKPNPNKIKVSIPEKFKDDPTLVVKNNRIFVQMKNLEGELMWEKIGSETKPMMQDITPPPVATGVARLAMPSAAQMQMLAANVSQSSASSMAEEDILNSRLASMIAPGNF
jgi:hypothetical protein